jgi:hypothetical protein
MDRMDLNCLTERHLLIFGTIVQWFARYELLIQEIIAAAAGCDSGSIIVLTHDLDFRVKRQALLDLLRHRNIPLDQYDRINAYLMVPYTLASLRNNIVHSAWIAGPASSWVQPDWVRRLPPSVRPFQGNGLIESEQDKVAFSLEDLNESVETLATNYTGFSSYLREVGLTGRRSDPQPSELILNDRQVPDRVGQST